MRRAIVYSLANEEYIGVDTTPSPKVIQQLIYNPKVIQPLITTTQVDNYELIKNYSYISLLEAS